jgi:hypothetical protein
MKGILNRMHQQQEESDEYLLRLQNDNSSTDDNNLSKEELVHLLTILNECKDDDDDKLQHLLSMQSPRIRSSLDRMIRSQIQGNTTDSLSEWVLEPWYLRWRRELVANAGDDDEPEFSTRQCKTLDERILETRLLANLRSGAGHQPLQYNLVDILYNVAWMLRLYHIPDNAAEQEAVSAINTMLQASAVLL